MDNMKKYILKCDLSGIQSFIFNVPGDGAARELKKRSGYVQTVADDCLKQLRGFLGITDDDDLLYNGGGNFYLKAETERTETELSDFIASLCEGYKLQDIFPYIAFVENNKGEVTKELLDAVNKKIQRAKLRRPLSYETFDAKQQPVPDRDTKDIKGINDQVPRDENGQMLDFDKIVKFSEGDEKLAALKLDVDNLGALFRDRKEDDYKKLSGELTEFFDGHLLELIKKNKMKQHVYTVFSGGDDCFLIGCWDRIFELAIVMRNEFRTFQK
ncbi:MAG: hypothetical protein LBD35_00490, partial [Prevotellaceae bacterium]|nr:hypothetical protein [Prevotellaceae bacterium]